MYLYKRASAHDVSTEYTPELDRCSISSERFVGTGLWNQLSTSTALQMDERRQTSTVPREIRGIRRCSMPTCSRHTLIRSDTVCVKVLTTERLLFASYDIPILPKPRANIKQYQRDTHTHTHQLCPGHSQFVSPRGRRQF